MKRANKSVAAPRQPRSVSTAAFFLLSACTVVEKEWHPFFPLEMPLTASSSNSPYYAFPSSARDVAKGIYLPPSVPGR